MTFLAVHGHDLEAIRRVLRMSRQPQALMVLAALAIQAVWSATIVDIYGERHRLPSHPGRAFTVVFFVAHDCPISNRYMPEIRRICGEYAAWETRCLMAYVDPTIRPEEIREHQLAYGVTLPALHDTNRELVELAGATVTPESAVYNDDGELVYRGRINNLYAALGTPRRQATEHSLRMALDEALAGRAVSQPRTQAVGCFIPDWKAAKTQKPE